MAHLPTFGVLLLALTCSGIPASGSLESLKESLLAEITPGKLLKQVTLASNTPDGVLRCPGGVNMLGNRHTLWAAQQFP